MQTLVKRRSDGGIQELSIEVQGNGFRVTAGKQGGKQRINEWTYCKGKNQGKSNETTDEEQAQVQAKAKWDKKLGADYALDVDSVDDLGLIFDAILIFGLMFDAILIPGIMFDAI